MSEANQVEEIVKVLTIEGVGVKSTDKQIATSNLLFVFRRSIEIRISGGSKRRSVSINKWVIGCLSFNGYISLRGEIRVEGGLRTFVSDNESVLVDYGRGWEDGLVLLEGVSSVAELIDGRVVSSVGVNVVIDLRGNEVVYNFLRRVESRRNFLLSGDDSDGFFEVINLGLEFAIIRLSW